MCLGGLQLYNSIYAISDISQFSPKIYRLKSVGHR